jgi:murein DD-endopeptidase MepM/ murein hydrolase activator NlpD
VAVEHGFGYSTYYAHNRKLNVRIGQTVKRGDVIGYIGSTGNSTGPHVHYEVWKDGKPLNPSGYLDGRV